MSDRLGGGRYELEDRIGHGGMATVYAARDLKLDRQVAIKLLAENLTGDEEIRKRFIREARLAAKLDHPNVVKVFDVGEEGERSYIVMERVEGGTLADRLPGRRRALARDEALHLLCQMCEGLGHAHDRKLVHRDIKPQNLLLRESDGWLKIADFGIARAAEETTRLTKPGKVIGTDRYMAPEQLADGRITPATDVYACGVVADEVLPGPRPPELREIIERCLREDPRQRFQDATALGDALAAVDGNGDVGVIRRIRTRHAAPTRELTAPTATKSPTTGGRPTIPLIGRSRGTSSTATRQRSQGAGARVAAIVLVAAAAIAAAAIALGGGGSDTPTKAKSSSVQPRPTVSVPESADPSQQARALADFLRAQARRQGPG